MASVGGSFAIIPARLLPPPALITADDKVCGSVVVNPSMSIEKNIPILAVVPTFLRVDNIPEAEPLTSGGTDDMTAAVFGALLGINPIKAILELYPTIPISPSAYATMTARTWFPTIFAPAFMHSLHIVFYVGAAIVFVGALVSIFREPLRKPKAEKADKLETKPESSDISDRAVKMKR